MSSVFQEINNLKEFVKARAILTPGALLVRCEPQLVLHFGGIAGTQRHAHKLCFEH